jgi:small-conductance mechanosensitive channel
MLRLAGLADLCRGAVRCLLAVGVLVCCTAVARAADPQGAGADADVDRDAAEVVVDGRVILRVRGVASYPARRRAKDIAERIAQVASDPAIAADSVIVVEAPDRSQLLAADRSLLYLFDVDAGLEGVERPILAEVVKGRLQEAITQYRSDRSPDVLLLHSVYALGATLAAVVLVFGLRRASRTLDGLVVRRLRDHLKALEAQSARFVKAQHLARALRSLIRVLYLVLLALALYFYLNFVLGLYPWTRSLAAWLFALILDPLRTMGAAVLETIPDLAFLVVLVFVARYLLRMIRAFFEGIDSGVIQLASFEQEWAWPTYRILRLLVIIFALVVAYPYIPGSESDAFKGISIFLGLIVSLGSSSIIANFIAGYSLAYRQPFKIGDRVKINDIVGEVVEMRVLVTRLRSPKNEEIVIPSTTILNGDVVNFSTLADEQGLILHTRVGIGYETPWRQVEAMLKLAADRTPGLLKKPAPFVLIKSLGDFAVNYELNAYCNAPETMLALYTVLHQKILDVFNEYGVAIMTPAYVADPQDAKLVPKESWFAAPATPPAAPAAAPPAEAGA